jgi:recombination protein RecR
VLSRPVGEIIIGLELNLHGDVVTRTIEEIAGKKVKKITRLARGIPTGGGIEFADEETLRSALKRRE